ncbi:hypothetical protein M8J77_006974 [Diaphorina citri]|nr:hypothetical protein M8J77_006974 [Diaphorina citri]
MLENPSIIPPDLTEGITYLKPKGDYTADPSKHRPITCLNTAYKIFTALINNKIAAHLDHNAIIAEEQKGCRKNSRGCKDQLIMDEIITGQIREKNRNAAISWIDYKKAFDSIPHTWLLKVLDLYKIHPRIRKALQACMATWKTDLTIQAQDRIIRVNNIEIKCGIFQGDSLSPVWFCMAINALSYLLNRSGMGFVIKTPDGTEETLNHLLYIDDLKLYEKNKDQLASLMNTVLKFTTDIKMEFGLDKCAHISIEHGKVIDTETLELMLNDVSIQNLDENQYYKYLGIKQYLNINHSQIKRELTNQYKSRLKKILNTGLKSKHLFMAINTYCVPILTYSFGLIKWSETDVKALDIDTRVSLTKNNTHHPKSSKERLYIPRKNGGRGLVNIASQWKTQTTKLREYFQQVKNRSNKIKNMCRADNKYTPLQLNQEYSDIHKNNRRDQRKRTKLEKHGITRQIPK